MTRRELEASQHPSPGGERRAEDGVHPNRCGRLEGSISFTHVVSDGPASPRLYPRRIAEGADDEHERRFVRNIVVGHEQTPSSPSERGTLGGSEQGVIGDGLLDARHNDDYAALSPPPLREVGPWEAGGSPRSLPTNGNKTCTEETTPMIIPRRDAVTWDPLSCAGQRLEPLRPCVSGSAKCRATGKEPSCRGLLPPINASFAPPFSRTKPTPPPTWSGRGVRGDAFGGIRRSRTSRSSPAHPRLPHVRPHREQL